MTLSSAVFKITEDVVGKVDRLLHFTYICCLKICMNEHKDDVEKTGKAERTKSRCQGSHEVVFIKMAAVQRG